MRGQRSSYQRERLPLVRLQPAFPARLALACQQIRRSARLTESDSQLLSDYSRPDARGVIGISRLADISATCSDLCDATALADAFRGHALASNKSASLTVLEAMRLEAAADGAEDAAVMEYLASPCNANAERAIEALRRVVETSQAVIDALHRRGAE